MHNMGPLTLNVRKVQNSPVRPTAAQQTFKAFATASLTTIDEVESETGLDFFKDLPDNIEQELESKKATEQELNTLLN